MSAARNRATLALMRQLGALEAFAGDLAPGDRGLADRAWPAFELRAVRSAADADFGAAYDLLWNEFGPSGEMERREVIADRLQWDPRRPEKGCAMLYEMLVVRIDGRIVAVRDHTAILPPALLAASPHAAAVVHLSHVLVDPALRGRGLAGWLRAMPVRAARDTARLAGIAAPATTLVAEMEHDDGSSHMPGARLRSYARAGFRLADPRRARYLQPDFRDPAAIERDRPRPVPLGLVLRRCGREHETEMPAAELRAVIAALHAMFALHVRPEHMRGVYDAAAALAADDAPVQLFDPAGRGADAGETNR